MMKAQMNLNPLLKTSLKEGHAFCIMRGFPVPGAVKECNSERSERYKKN